MKVYFKFVERLNLNVKMTLSCPTNEPLNLWKTGEDKLLFKVWESCLLIHELANLLFVNIYLLISAMTGYSHLCPLIKLIHTRMHLKWMY